MATRTGIGGLDKAVGACQGQHPKIFTERLASRSHQLFIAGSRQKLDMEIDFRLRMGRLLIHGQINGARFCFQFGQSRIRGLMNDDMQRAQFDAHPQFKGLL